jgi:hypothetical protein
VAEADERLRSEFLAQQQQPPLPLGVGDAAEPHTQGAPLLYEEAICEGGVLRRAAPRPAPRPLRAGEGAGAAEDRLHGASAALMLDAAETIAGRWRPPEPRSGQARCARRVRLVRGEGRGVSD